MTDIISHILQIKGAMQVIQLDNEDRNHISTLEDAYEKSQIVKVVNSGIRSVLQRDTALAVLKDTTFRKPPAPTVLMVEEISEKDTIRDNRVVLDGKPYRVVGTEIFDKNISFNEEYIFISSGFVLFTERRKNRGHIPSYFLMPSISFPELEENKRQLGITSIISASPSSPSDDYLRGKYHLPNDNQLATILIGFNTAS